MKTIVDGLELFAIKGRYGIYLKRDDCGAVIDADVDPATGRVSSDEVALIKKALRAGWTGDFTRSCSNDKCPTCSANSCGL